jgi:hypothetical protein
VVAQVEALLTATDEDIPVQFRSCNVSKEIQSLKLVKACGFDGIPNEYLRYLPRHLMNSIHLFDHCLRLGNFPETWKEVKIIKLPKPGKDTKLPQNLHPSSLLSTKGKLFENLFLRSIQEHTGKEIY